MPVAFNNTSFHKDGPWTAEVGCADWLETQWEASYKSIPFSVEVDTKSGGRRLHVHEYPGRERWDNEDLGRLRQQFDVSAFVYGDKVDKWAELLFAACVDPDSGMLTLPFRVPVKARCITIDSTWVANEMGKMYISMRFSLDPDPPGGVVPSSAAKSPTFLAGRVALATGEATTASRNLFEEEFTGDQAQVGRTSAAKMMQTVARVVRRASSQARVLPAQASEIDFLSRQIETLAHELSASQKTVANVQTQTAAVKSQKKSKIPTTSQPVNTGVAIIASTGQVTPALGTTAEGFGGYLEKAVQKLADGAPDPGDLGQALKELSEVNTNKLLKATSTTLTTSSLDEIHLANAVASFSRRLALVQICLAGIKVAPEKQPDATLLRNRLLLQIDNEAALATHDNPTYDSLRKLRANVTEYVSYWTQGGRATQKIRRKSGRTLANAAADIYAQSRFEDRDREMMRLNNVRHPLFAPNDLTYLNTK